MTRSISARRATFLAIRSNCRTSAGVAAMPAATNAKSPYRATFFMGSLSELVGGHPIGVIPPDALVQAPEVAGRVRRRCLRCCGTNVGGGAWGTILHFA